MIRFVHHRATLSLCVSAALISGCAAPIGFSDPNHTNTAYVMVGGGGTQFDPDTQGDELQVSSKTSTSVHLGLGYQLNSLAAAELRIADLGGVEYDDGRTLGYQLVDATGLLVWRQQRASVFGRAGIGTFRNDGDRKLQH